MPRQQELFTYTINDLAACTGQARAKVVEQRNAGEFDSARLETVALYLCQRGQKTLRQAVVNTALGLIVDIPVFKRSKEVPTDLMTYTYETLCDLTGSEINTVRQHRTRHRLDTDQFESVIVFLARFALPRLRRAMVHYSLLAEPAPGDIVIPRR